MMWVTPLLPVPVRPEVYTMALTYVPVAYLRRGYSLEGVINDFSLHGLYQDLRYPCVPPKRHHRDWEHYLQMHLLLHPALVANLESYMLPIGPDSSMNHLMYEIRTHEPHMRLLNYYEYPWFICHTYERYQIGQLFQYVYDCIMAEEVVVPPIEKEQRTWVGVSAGTLTRILRTYEPVRAYNGDWQLGLMKTEDNLWLLDQVHFFVERAGYAARYNGPPQIVSWFATNRQQSVVLQELSLNPIVYVMTD